MYIIINLHKENLNFMKFFFACGLRPTPLPNFSSTASINRFYWLSELVYSYQKLLTVPKLAGEKQHFKKGSVK